METGEIYPRLFCLMQHRRKENYIKLYQLIADKGWDFEIMKPGGQMYMDMETANKSACQECLSNPDDCVCYFHLCGITNKYKSIVDIGLLRKLLRNYSSTLKTYTLQLCPFYSIMRNAL
jgi:hypothetical protein